MARGDIISKLVGEDFQAQLARLFPRDQSPATRALFDKHQFPLSPASHQKLNKVLIEPIWSYLDRPGKRMRPALVQLSADFLGVRAPHVHTLKLYIELLHEATLIIDDIQDNSDRRKGLPSAHVMFGLDQAVSSGCKMLAIDCIEFLIAALGALSPQHELLIRRVHSRFLNLIFLGTSLDVWWHRPKSLAEKVSFEDYRTMVALKTSMLMELCLEVFAIFDPGLETAHLKKAIENFGVAFQIHDDIINVESSEYACLKGAADDIQEGKMSFMLVHCMNEMRDARELERLLALVNKQKKSDADIEAIVAIYRAEGAVERGKEWVKALLRESTALLEEKYPGRGESLADWRRLVDFCFKLL